MSVYYRVLWLHPLMTVAFRPFEERNLSEQFVPGDKVRIESDVTESVFYCLSKVEPGKK